jgi:hypothetical protein
VAASSAYTLLALATYTVPPATAGSENPTSRPMVWV